MPRSLASCYENLVQNLDRIAGNYGRQGPAQRQARSIRARLQNSRMDEIFQTACTSSSAPSLTTTTAWAAR